MKKTPNEFWGLVCLHSLSEKFISSSKKMLPIRTSIVTDLTPLINFLKGDRDPREYRRALAVRLALSGHKHREIKSMLGVSSAFVSKWKARYEKRGVEALKLGYKGHISYLNYEQKQEVVD